MILNINPKHTGHDISFIRNLIILLSYCGRFKKIYWGNVNPLEFFR